MMQRHISKAVEAISQQSGAVIRIAPNIPDLPVTVRVTNGTVEDALRALVENIKSSLPNLSYRALGNNTYQLELKTN